MPKSRFFTAISRPRYLRYLSACGDKRRALMLYRANIALSSKIFAVIGELLMNINEIRNRIAHHEPICFHGNLISTTTAQKRYNTLLELLNWLGCDPHNILYGIDGVHQPLKAIKHIQTLINSRSKF